MDNPAYWAGFFDGEGCIDLRFRETHNGKYKRFELRLSVSQVHTGVLLLMQKQYGGSICTPKGGTQRIVIVGAQAEIMLRDMQPFCVVKADELQIALRFIDLVASTPAHHAKGQHRFSKTPVEIEEKKVLLFHEMRAARVAKGLKPKTRPGVKQPYAA